MDLSHQFSVPTPVEETWAHFQDIASVAECFPGAQVTDDDGNTFHGSVKVKLGPIALVYNGSGTFVEKDDVQHRFVVDAKGKDKRGNGTAGAKVTLSMVTSASGGTDVDVLTDLAVTGKPAQFGRGVMQDVSDKLLGQFVACLEQRLGEPIEPAADVPPEVSAGPQAVAAAAERAAEPSPPSPAPVPTPDVGAGSAGPPSAAAPPRATAPRREPTPGPAPAAASRPDDAINLGATVLPVLVKSYWKQGLGLLLLLLVIRRLLR